MVNKNEIGCAAPGQHRRDNPAGGKPENSNAGIPELFLLTG